MLWPEVPYRNSARRLSAPWALCPGIHGRRNCPCLAQDPRRTDGEADPAPSDIERMTRVQSHSQCFRDGWLPSLAGSLLLSTLSNRGRSSSGGYD
jgi:hypothetical protein